MAGQKEETTVLSAADEEQEQEERLLEDVAVLDFDMLCATVAMQTQGFSVGNTGKVGGGGGEEEGEFGGVQRMWEGEVLHCFEDRRIALETVCCPCYRFGKNMERAGFGTSCLQGTVYVVLVAVALLNYVAFGVTRRHSFLYLAVAFTILIGTYLGLFRTQIRKQFNITGSDSALDDCMQHIFCPCCTLCQESRTLEINNVQDGVWRGRGDTICVGRHSEKNRAFFELRQSEGPTLISSKTPELFIMEREANSDNHAWNIDRNHSQPLVQTN